MTDRGHYRAYESAVTGPERLAAIEAACVIIGEYEGAGYAMTLRQLYYQMVARGTLPNRPASYNWLGALISDGRMRGLISWTAIEDRGRNLYGVPTTKSPADALAAAAKTYRRDLWEDQPFRPEIWVEKEALAGVVADVANRLRCDYFATRGYNSQSEQWRAGQRFAGRVRRGQRTVVLHLGDHDPSGIDMTRDISARLALFAGTPIMVVRLALNWDQIEELKPPPNPAKMTDSRADDYVRRFGHSSWELDALSPRSCTIS